MIKYPHGCMIAKGLWSGSRQCNVHKHHGALYACEYYGRSLKNKIGRLARRFKKNPMMFMEII